MNIFHHFKFEILAYLFYSESLFKKGAWDLVNEKELHESSWSEDEHKLASKLPGISLESLQGIRDDIWQLNTITANHSYLRILRQTAQKHLSTQGASASLFIEQLSSSSESESVSLWRWLNFALPSDLLLAALGLNEPYEITSSSPLLEQHWLEHGLAQIHVHLGAETDFPTYWASAMQALTKEDITPQALASDGAAFENGKNLAPWLLCGAIVRLVLYGFLLERQQGRTIAPLTHYLENLQQKTLHTYWPDLVWGLNQVLNSLLNPQTLPSIGFQKMQELYSLIMPVSIKVSSLQDVWLLDPLVRMGPLQISPRNREIYWHRLAFQYLETAPRDILFATLFWQVIRTKVIFYRHIIQRPMVKGLQWFIRHYDRIGPLAKPAKKFRLEQAFHMDGGPQGMKSLEVRIAPDQDACEIREKIFELTHTWYRLKSRGNNEVGVVIHLPKQREPDYLNFKYPLGHHWRNSHTNPANHPSHYRYSQFANQKQREVNAVCQHLKQVPLSLALVRASDMCTDEISIPNWVMAPLLKQIEKAGHQASACLYHLHPQWKIPPLRKTMHVGEDFHHLMDGIRRMDEVVMRFPLGLGDRIGHGLALGLSPKHWSEKNPISWMPKEIRLWDLLWEWKQYELGQEQIPLSRLEKIKKSIALIGKDIFGSRCQIEDLRQLYEDLFDSEKLYRVGYPNGEFKVFGLEKLTDENRDLYWLYLYLTHSHCFHECYEIIEIKNTQDEVDALYAMQRIVRGKILNRDISIEVNPSSNFLIADLQNLEHHPLWNLNPPPGHKGEQEMGPPINICIGSDDPITFSTNLPQEYELLYHVLHEKKVGREEARQWLNKIRQTGLNARFTLSFGQDNRDANIVWERLLKDLKADWSPPKVRTTS
ncbi:MAG: hypothetical protein AB7I41_06105 [Candidatus Sericytochromatia bacterium]